MKYFLDTEFIEGFHKPLFSKRRHFIDLISIGIVSEDNRALYFISSEYNYNDADPWVMANVITPAYIDAVHGDNRNFYSSDTFHKRYGTPVKQICKILMDWIGEDNDISFYGYYSDYDWVLLCSMFGRMNELPAVFPMYCRDIKQMMDEKGVDYTHPDCPKQKGNHISLHDAAWNKEAYEWLSKI